MLLVYAGLVVEEGKGTTKDTLQIPQPDGTRVPIVLKKVDCPEKKLGIYTCPTGDFSYHVSQLVETGSEYAARLRARHLPARDAWMGKRYQLFPKLIYGAAAVTHAPQALEDACQSIWYKLLPSLRVNRNITKEYRMLPLRFQGLALPNPNIESLSRKIHLLQTNWTRAVRSVKCYTRHIKFFKWRWASAGTYFLNHMCRSRVSQLMVSFGIYGSY
jgi:hypothetical protein